MRFAPFFVLLVSGFAAGDGYAPLITDNTLEHFMGDKQHWRFRGELLTGESATSLNEPSFLLSTERFGNFNLRFSARCSSGTCRILFRGTIQPPFQLVGYQAEIGGADGSLSFRKPGRFSLATMRAEPARGNRTRRGRIPEVHLTVGANMRSLRWTTISP